jgi:hypothetical protein
VIDMQLWALLALALLLAAFCLVHRLRWFVLSGAGVAAAFGVFTYPTPASEYPDEWLVSVAGLAAFVAGLAIVRLMLTRSVSLRMLARVDGADTSAFQFDIAERLNDLRRLRLVRRDGGRNSLTGFGRFTADTIGAFYTIMRIDR